MLADNNALDKLKVLKQEVPCGFQSSSRNLRDFKEFEYQNPGFLQQAVDSVVYKSPKYVSVLENEFEKYKREVLEGSAPDIIKRIEDPNDPYPFNREGVYSPVKGHIITGRVPGEMQYYYDICKHGPDIADKLNPRFASTVDQFRAGLLRKSETGGFVVSNHPVNDEKFKHLISKIEALSENLNKNMLAQTQQPVMMTFQQPGQEQPVSGVPGLGYFKNNYGNQENGGFNNYRSNNFQPRQFNSNEFQNNSQGRQNWNNGDAGNFRKNWNNGGVGNFRQNWMTEIRIILGRTTMLGLTIIISPTIVTGKIIIIGLIQWLPVLTVTKKGISDPTVLGCSKLLARAEEIRGPRALLAPLN